MKRENLDSLKTNPYSFAKEHIESTSLDSKEYGYRRKVSHFYSYLSSLVKNKIINENLLFSLIDPNQIVSLVEILEPIEVAISEKYFGLPKKEWDILWLRARCVKYIKKHKGKLKMEFVPPMDKDLYLQSLEKPDEKAEI